MTFACCWVCVEMRQVRDRETWSGYISPVALGKYNPLGVKPGPPLAIGCGARGRNARHIAGPSSWPPHAAPCCMYIATC